MSELTASTRPSVRLESNALKEAWPVLLKRLGYRFDWLQAAAARPAVPSVEERLGLRRALSAVEDLA